MEDGEEREEDIELALLSGSEELRVSAIDVKRTDPFRCDAV